MDYTYQRSSPTVSAENIAMALGKGKKVRNNKYIACCPAHDDQDPSLSITDSSDGKVLFHCFTGCSQKSVLDSLRSLGLWSQEKKPTPIKEMPDSKRYWHCQDVLDFALEDIRSRRHLGWSDMNIQEVMNAIEDLEKERNKSKPGSLYNA